MQREQQSLCIARTMPTTKFPTVLLVTGFSIHSLYSCSLSSSSLGLLTHIRACDTLSVCVIELCVYWIDEYVRFHTHKNAQFLYGRSDLNCILQYYMTQTSDHMWYVFLWPFRSMVLVGKPQAATSTEHLGSQKCACRLNKPPSYSSL